MADNLQRWPTASLKSCPLGFLQVAKLGDSLLPSKNSRTVDSNTTGVFFHYILKLCSSAEQPRVWVSVTVFFDSQEFLVLVQ